MTFELLGFHHVNVTVPQALEETTKHFYGIVLGLKQLQKPAGSRTSVGAWYDLGGLQLHLSIEDHVDNQASDRHVCYSVRDVAAAEQHFREAGVKSFRPAPIPADRAVLGSGNLIEIAQRRGSSSA